MTMINNVFNADNITCINRCYAGCWLRFVSVFRGFRGEGCDAGRLII